MTEAPDLAADWPAIDRDAPPDPLDPTTPWILYDLTRELGIPQALLSRDLTLCGTDSPGEITFDFVQGWSWSELWAEFDRPLAGLPTPHPRPPEDEPEDYDGYITGRTPEETS